MRRAEEAASTASCLIRAVVGSVESTVDRDHIGARSCGRGRCGVDDVGQLGVGDVRVDGGVGVSNQIVDGLAPGRGGGAVQGAGDVDRARRGGLSSHALCLSEGDVADTGIEVVARCIRADALHRALGGNFATEEAGAEVAQGGIAVGERVVGGDVGDVGAQSRCFGDELPAMQIAIDDERLQQRAIGVGLILRGP